MKKGLRVNLTIRDVGLNLPRERDIIDKIVGFTTEKSKGLMMLERIQDRFGITDRDRENFIKETILKLNSKIAITPIKWTRDNKGKIISPFNKK